ncbi:MAG: poly-gamma-glutamate biosynthesis protein PgsC [candidate division WOR-3 bacterium]
MVIIEGIGLGMLLSFFMTETIGLAAGGIVVPGYLALNLHHPFKIILTFFIALLVYLINLILSKYVILYGRRLLLISVILGYLFGYLFKLFPPITYQKQMLNWEVIGYVIPGLLAYWSQRQGIIETFSTALVGSVITRLILILINSGKVFIFK